jgi:hypothetical protein
MGIVGHVVVGTAATVDPMSVVVVVAAVKPQLSSSFEL